MNTPKYIIELLETVLSPASLKRHWPCLLVVLSGFIFGVMWKYAQLTLISEEVRRLYPIHLYADSAFRTVLIFLMLWLVFAHLAHWLLGIGIGTALKIDSVGFAVITLTFLFYNTFLDFHFVHPAIGKTFLASKLLYSFYIPYGEFWERLKGKADYVLDVLLILLLFSLIFIQWIPLGVDKFQYFRDFVSAAQFPRTILIAMNAIRYFDFHLWDSFTNAGSTPITFWSTVQYHSMGLLDSLLGFTSFDFFDVKQLGNYTGYTFLALLLFSWISVYFFLRLMGFSRFSSYLLGLAYPFIGIFQFVDSESEVVYQALIFPFVALCTLWVFWKKTIASALWLGFTTAILIHYFFNFPAPPYFAHTYLFLIGWMVYMVFSCKGERTQYVILMSTFLISHTLLLMPKILALMEFTPRIPGLAPHGYSIVSHWQQYLGLYHNVLRFFYFWVEPNYVQHVYKWYYMFTPVTFLFFAGAYALSRYRDNYEKRDLRNLTIFYSLGYMVLYFFFQISYEPSIIQAWLYKISQITVVHYTFNSGYTFTLCFLIVAAIGLDWFVSSTKANERTYVPVIVFNIALLIMGILFLAYPIHVKPDGSFESGMIIDSKVIGKMLFIVISTNMMIYLLSGLSPYPAFRNLIVTAVFVIYVSNVLQPYLKYDKFIDGTHGKECNTPLSYYAYYLKNNLQDLITYENFRKRALPVLQREDLRERTSKRDKSDAYFNEIILNNGSYVPEGVPDVKDRLSLPTAHPLPSLELYHTQADYRDYRYSSVGSIISHYAYAPIANSFPLFLVATDDGPRCLIPLEMVPFNEYKGDGWVNPRTGLTQMYCTLNLDYHLSHPYLMDILGIKYLYITKEAYEIYSKKYGLGNYCKLKKRFDGNEFILENEKAKPIAYLASDYRLMPDKERKLIHEIREKKNNMSELRNLRLDPDILLIESDRNIPHLKKTDYNNYSNNLCTNITQAGVSLETGSKQNGVPGDAFDTSDDSFFGISNPSIETVVFYDFNTPASIRYIDARCANAEAHSSLWEVVYSDDATTWTSADRELASNRTSQPVYIPERGSHRYWGFRYVLQIQGDVAAFSSIEMRGIRGDGGEKSGTILPPVENVNTRFNWAVFRVKNNPQYSLLFHSDNYDKGWNGYIDGRRTNIYRTQLAFKSVVVPPGDHLVWFEYRPGSFVYGFYIFCFVIIGTAIFAMRQGDGPGIY